MNDPGRREIPVDRGAHGVGIEPEDVATRPEEERRCQVVGRQPHLGLQIGRALLRLAALAIRRENVNRVQEVGKQQLLLSRPSLVFIQEAVFPVGDVGRIGTTGREAPPPAIPPSPKHRHLGKGSYTIRAGREQWTRVNPFQSTSLRTKRVW